jgi:hypothetical protein
MKKKIEDLIEKIKKSNVENISEILNFEDKELLKIKIDNKNSICKKILNKINKNINNKNEIIQSIYNIKSNFFKKIMKYFDEFEKKLEQENYFDFYSLKEVIKKKYIKNKKSNLKLKKEESFIFTKAISLNSEQVEKMNNYFKKKKKSYILYSNSTHSSINTCLKIENIYKFEPKIEEDSLFLIKNISGIYKILENKDSSETNINNLEEKIISIVNNKKNFRFLKKEEESNNEEKNNNKIIEQKINNENDEKKIEEKLIEEKINNKKIIEEKLIEEKINNKKIIEEKLIEEKKNNKKIIEEKKIEEKIIEEKIIDEKIIEEEVIEEKIIEEKIIEKKIVEEKIEEKIIEEKKNKNEKEEKIINEKIDKFIYQKNTKKIFIDGSKQGFTYLFIKDIFTEKKIFVSSYFGSETDLSKKIKEEKINFGENFINCDLKSFWDIFSVDNSIHIINSPNEDLFYKQNEFCDFKKSNKKKIIEELKNWKDENQFNINCLCPYCMYKVNDNLHASFKIGERFIKLFNLTVIIDFFHLYIKSIVYFLRIIYSKKSSLLSSTTDLKKFGFTYFINQSNTLETNRPSQKICKYFEQNYKVIISNFKEENELKNNLLGCFENFFNLFRGVMISEEQIKNLKDLSLYDIYINELLDVEKKFKIFYYNLTEINLHYFHLITHAIDLFKLYGSMKKFYNSDMEKYIDFVQKTRQKKTLKNNYLQRNLKNEEIKKNLVILNNSEFQTFNEEVTSLNFFEKKNNDKPNTFLFYFYEKVKNNKTYDNLKEKIDQIILKYKKNKKRKRIISKFENENKKRNIIEETMIHDKIIENKIDFNKKLGIVNDKNIFKEIKGKNDLNNQINFFENNKLENEEIKEIDDEENEEKNEIGCTRKIIETLSDIEIIEYCFDTKKNDSEILANPITRFEIKCLQDKKFVNDGILNEFVQKFEIFNEILIINSHIVNLCNSGGNTTKVNKYLQKKKFSKFLKVFAVINIENTHWILYYGNLNFQKHFILDSLGFRNNVEYVKILISNLNDFYKNGMSNWKWDFSLEYPKQNNSYDCGVFVMKYLEYLALNKKFDFNQEKMLTFRKEILLKIIKFTK